MSASMLRRLGRWVVRLVLVALLTVVVGAVTVLIVLPRATHGTALTVLTGSMTPDIPVGSVVIDRPVDANTLKVGDVATYQKAPGVDEYITHRIIKINTKTNPVTFTFKGDANRGPDIAPVPATAIRGKVWFHVPYLGGIRDSLRAGGLRGVAILLAIVGLAGFALVQFVSWARDRRRTAEDRDDLCFRLETAALDGIDVATLADVLGGTIEPVDGAEDEPRIVRFGVSGSSARLDVIRALLDPFGEVVVAHDELAAEPASHEARWRLRRRAGMHRSQVDDG